MRTLFAATAAAILFASASASANNFTDQDKAKYPCLVEAHIKQAPAKVGSVTDQFRSWSDMVFVGRWRDNEQGQGGGPCHTMVVTSIDGEGNAKIIYKFKGSFTRETELSAKIRGNVLETWLDGTKVVYTLNGATNVKGVYQASPRFYYANMLGVRPQQ